MTRPDSYDVHQPGLSEMIEMARGTWHPGVLEVPGLGYAIESRPETPDYFISYQTDGIGTKGILHAQHGTEAAAATDALAMCLNDALLVKSDVKSVIDYVSVPTDDPGVKERFMFRLATDCLTRGISIPAGETAVMDIHEDIGPVVVTYGLIDRPEDIAPAEFVRSLNRFRPGDALLGLPSSGIHANGLTHARDILERAGELEDHLDELTRPTTIYYEHVRQVYDKIGGMMHITGGGFSKLKKVLPPDCDALISQPRDLAPQAVFHEIQDLGQVSDREMYERYNNGVGFVLSVAEVDAEEVMRVVGLGIERLGQIVPGSGRVEVHSAYSGKPLFW